MFKIVLDFLNNNLGVITLFVGTFAILLYIHQKTDYKREIAKLILQEIRFAEKQIKVAREHSNVFLLSNTLLPTNSWYHNIHLFASDLEETDRDSISDFYSKVSFLDRVISKIAEVKLGRQVAVQFQGQVNQPPAITPAGSANVVPQGAPNIPAQEPIQLITQLSAEVILKEVADAVEFLYNTPAADKLRELSRRKWYKL